MNYKLTEPLQSQFSNLENVGQFKTQKVKIRVLNGYSNQIIVVNKNKFISLTFKTKFQLLREHVNEKYKLGNPLGLLIERENNQHIIILFSDDVQMLQIGEIIQLNIQIKGDFMKVLRLIVSQVKESLLQQIWKIVWRMKEVLQLKHFPKKQLMKKKKERYIFKVFQMSMLNEITIMRKLDNHALIKLHEVYEKFPLHGTDLLEGGSLYDNVKIDHNLMHLKLKCLFLVYWKDFVICIKKVLCIEIQNQKIFYIVYKGKFKSIQEVIFHHYALLIFGLAQHSDKYPYLFNRCGTPGFLVPEVINSKDGGRYESICDVFSFGLIFYILLTLLENQYFQVIVIMLFWERTENVKYLLMLHSLKLFLNKLIQKNHLQQIFSIVHLLKEMTNNNGVSYNERNNQSNEGNSEQINRKSINLNQNPLYKYAIRK